MCVLRARRFLGLTVSQTCFLALSAWLAGHDGDVNVLEGVGVTILKMSRFWVRVWLGVAKI